MTHTSGRHFSKGRRCPENSTWLTADVKKTESVASWASFSGFEIILWVEIIELGWESTKGLGHSWEILQPVQVKTYSYYMSHIVWAILYRWAECLYNGINYVGIRQIECLYTMSRMKNLFRAGLHEPIEMYSTQISANMNGEFHLERFFQVFKINLQDFTFFGSGWF